MKLIVPDYYIRFRCIADRCRHSCCIGWEIDIDEDSLTRFQAVTGPLGQRLQENIDLEDTPHFRLGAEERCPFLNEEGLCDLIIGLGEDSLCQICADHPRFRNEFTDRTEMGLGLTCEAAAALIIEQQAPMTLMVLEDDGGSECADEDEAWLLQARDNAMAVAQDRSFPVAERMEHLGLLFGTARPTDPVQWAEVYLGLERLDEQWTQLLEALRAPLGTPAPCSETALEQLLVYFLYRHMPAALRDSDVATKVGFAILSVTMLQWLHTVTGLELTELARMYSSEIEYSDENLDILWDILYDTI